MTSISRYSPPSPSVNQQRSGILTINFKKINELGKTELEVFDTIVKSWINAVGSDKAYSILKYAMTTKEGLLEFLPNIHRSGHTLVTFYSVDPDTQKSSMLKADYFEKLIDPIKMVTNPQDLFKRSTWDKLNLK